LIALVCVLGVINLLRMAFLALLFTVFVGLYVVALIVFALAVILGSERDDRKLKKREREPRPGDY